MIHDLKKQGLSLTAIARRVGCDRKTVRKYLERGLEAPIYGPRQPRDRLLDHYEGYLRERVLTFPDLSGARLLRDIRDMGYAGGYTAVTDFLREVRSPARTRFERRFETPPGRQAQVDFAEFTVSFTPLGDVNIACRAVDEPGVTRKVWVPPFNRSPGPIVPFGSGFNLDHPGPQPLALGTSMLLPIKTLESFDFSFQPSLDRERIAALAQLDFVRRAEVVHFLGPPGTGKSHLATALGVGAVKSGRQVYRASLAELIDALARAERQGKLAEKIRFYTRASLLIVDEIGYLPISRGGANLFFQLVNARYEKGAFAIRLEPMAPQ